MEEIPANCILSKGTTGCGATTLATVQNTPTLIAMPFVELNWLEELIDMPEYRIE